MPTHFNPPPGWPIPSGWAPPPNWEPDPTWAAAPPGWQFWIDEVPNALADTEQPGPDPTVEHRVGVAGWAATDAPTELGETVELDQRTGPQRQTGSPSSISKKRVILAIVAGAVAAVLALVGVLTVAIIHRRNTVEAVKPSDIPDSDPHWTTVPTTSPLIPPPVAAAPPRKPSSNARPPGDLGLRTPISFPKCDGQGIVILGSLVEPSRYATGVQQLLDAHPGAAYLRTDLSCRSLTQRTDQGDAIYAVYTLTGHTKAQLCAAVRAAGGDSYGKWLDNTTDPDHIVPC